MCFASQLWVSSFSTHSALYLVLFVASVCFIIIPLIFNVFQLNGEIKCWTKNQNSDVYTWIKTRFKFIYLLTFVSGSCFSMISLCNSYMFQLQIFCMGLSKNQLAVFRNKRIFSIVLLEVKTYIYVYLHYNIKYNIVYMYIFLFVLYIFSRQN